MLVVQSPQALPGSCYFCGSSNRECFVDTLRQIEFHGALYICDICVVELGSLMGLFSVEKSKELTQLVESLREENFKLQQTNEGLNRAVNGLTVAHRYSQPDSHTGVVDTAPKITERTQGATSSVDSGESGTDEPSDESQLDGVQQSSSNDSTSRGEFKLSGI